MITRTQAMRTLLRRIRNGMATMIVATLVLAGTPASMAAAVKVDRTSTVMTYNVYLGANLQPLFAPVSNPAELIQRAAAIFAHLDLVNFRMRAVAIAQQIIEQDPDAVALQEVSLWQTAPFTNPTDLTTRYDFLQILLDELQRQGHPFRAASVSTNFVGRLPINLTTYGVYTDRNVIIVSSGSDPEITTSDPAAGVFDAAFHVRVGGMPLDYTRGWASVKVTFNGRTYRLFDTHFEAFDSGVREDQVRELAQIMSGSPYPVVLAGDINLYPMGVRTVDDAAWDAMSAEGFVDAWVQAECFEPRFTAGQTDNLDNVPSNLDNTVDYVLFDEDGDAEPIERSCDIAGEELDDRTNTVPALWPSDHAAVVVEMRIARP